MKSILIFSIVIITFFSCNDTDNVLKKYYNNNTQLHHALADSLINYAIKHKTEVTMQKRLDGQNQIYFGYYFQEGNIVRFVEFDDLLNRIDSNPEYTSKIEVPIEIIKLFKKTMYTSLIADSTRVFFGYKDSFDGNSKYGIFINRDSADHNIPERLAKNVFITRGIIP